MPVLHHLHRELEKLKKRLLTMAASVENAMDVAIESLLNRDPEQAQRVIDGDAKIDLMELEIDEECLKLLALYQPVAEDLRFLAAGMHINGELERVGDHAVNIAERALFLSDCDPVPITSQLRSMSQAAMKMVRVSLDAFVNHDADSAREVRPMDDEVDDGYGAIAAAVSDMMREDPGRIPQAMQLYSAAGHLERVGDLATRISEEIVYMVTGEMIRHRKKIEALLRAAAD